MGVSLDRLLGTIIVFTLCFSSCHAFADENIYMLKAKAMIGNVEAQSNLAIMYYNGEGVPQNYKKAIEWYTKAAEQGDVKAQVNLAVMCQMGEGGPQDYEKAVEWLTKAAEQGYADGQVNLAMMYSAGDGVPQDFVQAYAWMSVAKASGEINSATELEQLSTKMTQEQIVEGKALASEIWRRLQKVSPETAQ